ncbi:MAG: EamA family transporter [Firmicutes bacterium]|nr:EamA family transporter [Bacillota bacterium]
MSNNAKYSLLLILQSLFWGVGNPVMKIAMFTMPPLWCLFFRFALACLIFAVVFRRKLKQQYAPGHMKGCLLVGVSFAFAYIFAAFSLRLTMATISGFLMGLAVMFVPFIAWPLFHRPPRPAAFLAIVVTAVGMYLLCGGGDFSFGWGELLAIASSFCSALMFTTTERYVNEVGPELLSVVQTGVTALIVLVLALFMENLDLPAVSLTSWLSVLYMALMATCVACFIQNHALGSVRALTASFIYCLEPVFSAVASFFLLDEHTGLLGLIGAALIIAGIMLANVLGAAEDRRPPAEA